MLKGLAGIAVAHLITSHAQTQLKKVSFFISLMISLLSKDLIIQFLSCKNFSYLQYCHSGENGIRILLPNTAQSYVNSISYYFDYKMALFLSKTIKKNLNLSYFLPMRQNLFYFSGAGKFCLAHGLRQLTREVKNDVRTLNFRSDVTTKILHDVQGRSLCDVKCQK